MTIKLNDIVVFPEWKSNPQPLTSIGRRYATVPQRPYSNIDISIYNILIIS